MAKGYWVVRVDVIDPEQFKTYQAFVGPFLAEHDGRFLVRDGRHAVPEGTARQRTVVVEFPSYEAALRAYDSAEYQGGIAMRENAAVLDFVVVEGYEG
ncbi:MAG TPA: DUF1330 domain-containing protein [Devosia sp.]|nr:DUF1330 domain-containing protein [Devosia sp.]